MFAKHYENPTVLSRVTAKNVGDVFFDTHCRINPTPIPARCYQLPLNLANKFWSFFLQQ